MSDIRNLKLQVVLAAVDKMTGPLKTALSGSKALSGQLKATRQELAGLRDGQRSIETLARLREQAAQSTQAMRQSRQAIDQHRRALELAKTEQTDVSARLKVAQKHYDSLNESLIKFPQLAGNYTGAIAKARYELEALQKQHTTNKNAIRRSDEAIRSETKRLQENTARRSQLAEQLRKTTSSLRDAGIKTYKLGEHQAELASKMGEVNRKLAEQEARLAKVNKLQAKQRAIRAKYEGALQNRDRLAGAGASSMAAGSAVGLPVLSMVKDFSAYEDAMLGIARQVEGARDAGGKLTPTYYEMGAAIRDMSQQIPMATTELAALVEGGARMGIKGKAELLAFARTAALASTAFDLPADQISEDLGKIANTYKIPIKKIAELGDTINWLDDNAQSKGADIIEVMQRIAGSTGSMSYKEAAALGSTFLSLGASSEVAATATKAMVRELAIAEKQPKRFQAGLQALGLNAKKVQADMAKDSTGTILRVMEAVQKLPDSWRMGVVVDLFGKEYGDDAAKLADNLGEYRKQLALVNEQKAKGSMQREGDAKNDTLSAKYQIAQNTLFNAKAALGESLRAPAIEAMTAISGVLKSISTWTAANPQLAATLMKAAAAAAIITTVLGGMLLAVAGIIGPFIAARFAVSMALASFTSGIGVMGRLGSAIGMVGRVIAFVGRMMLLNPIGLAVTVIAGAAYLLWQNWATIGPKFAALWQYIKTSAAGLLAWFQGLPAAFVAFGSHMMDGLVGGITNGLARVKAAITGAGESTITWFKEKLGIHSPSRVFAQLGGWTMEGLGIGLDKGAGQPLASLQQLAGKLIERAKGIVLPAPAMATQEDDRATTRRRVLAESQPMLQRITAALPAISLPSFQLPNLPAVDTGGMGNGLATLRDMLGKISIATGLAGGMAMQPAAAVPIDTRPPVAVQRQATAPAAAPVYHIQINAAPGMNEAQLARMVAAELDRREREAGARRRSRLGDSD